MPRLRRVSVSDPGLGRRRHGRGFVYLDVEGTRITDPDVVARCEALVIPPAWTSVWICALPQGHVQAFGYDEAGRGQYLYHPQWALNRARAKHDHVLEVGRALPAARRAVARDLDLPGMPRERTLALAFRLLDIGYFRIGSETYAERNSSFGLATLLREHVTAGRDGVVRFHFPAKSGKEWDLAVDDLQVHAAVRTLLTRRGGSHLLAWRASARPVTWHEVTSADLGASVKDRLGEDATAKDFRTWHAGVIAARALAEAGDPPTSERGRRTVVAGVVREVAQALGNTPAVARASYIDPRILDHWQNGVRISPTRSTATAEAALLRLLGDERSPAAPRRAPTQPARSA